MFIAVAAGNSFATYQQVGLSYPAVSPSVVPVAAGNIDGTICSFSQRDSRVLVAPGTNVLTTVPNYTGNGSDDNFGLYAGTSMAAPFVAGASVLMRQAYQSVGVSNVTEQMLYNEMVNSSDTIYDAATGQSYHRINIERAIDDIMATAQPAAVATPAPLQTAATVDQVMQTPTSWLPQTTTAASVSTSSTSAALPVAAPSTPATAAAPVIASSGVKSVASKLTGVTAASAPVAKVVAKPLPQIRKARMES
jgi:subtilisin family serine protease